MDASIEHIERLLLNSNEPLSFIFFIPAEQPTRAQNRLEGSRFKRKQLTLVAFEHEFRHGFQHLVEPVEMGLKSPHRTLVVFLQNDAGFLRWGPTPDRVEAFLEAFKPGKEVPKEKELTLLSPPPTPQTTPTNSTSTSATSENSITGSEAAPEESTPPPTSPSTTND